MWVLLADQKVPFTLINTPRCREGHYSFLLIHPLTLDLYIKLLSVKHGGIKYPFLFLWYDSTWDWTPVFQIIGEHSTTVPIDRSYIIVWDNNLSLKHVSLNMNERNISQDFLFFLLSSFFNTFLIEHNRYFFCLHIFLLILSNCRIDLMIFGGNWLINLLYLVISQVLSAQLWAIIRRRGCTTKVM